MSSEKSGLIPHVKSGKGRRWRHLKRQVKHLSRKVMGWVLIAIGLVLIAAGVTLIIIPFHYFLVVAGLILVLGNSFWARRQFIHLKRRHPNWVMPLRKLLRKKNPPVASVFWQQTLKIERFFLRSRGFLVGLRRRMVGRSKKVASASL